MRMMNITKIIRPTVPLKIININYTLTKRKPRTYFRNEIIFCVLELSKLLYTLNYHHHDFKSCFHLHQHKLVIVVRNECRNVVKNLKSVNDKIPLK